MTFPAERSGILLDQWNKKLYKNNELITDIAINVTEVQPYQYIFQFDNDGTHDSTWTLILEDSQNLDVFYIETWRVEKRIIEQNVKYLRSRLDSEGGYFNSSSNRSSNDKS